MVREVVLSCTSTDSLSGVPKHFVGWCSACYGCPQYRHLSTAIGRLCQNRRDMGIAIRNYTYPRRSSQWHASGALMFYLAASAAVVLLPNALRGEETNARQGVAWRVQGLWRLEGEHSPVSAGGVIPAGSLLLPDTQAGDHSITILLPDGQRVLYECFTSKQCSRGFRVPALYRTPEQFAVDMLADIRAALVRHAKDGPAGSGLDSMLPRDEEVATMGPGGRVQLSGLVAALQDGNYTFEAHLLSSSGSERIRRTFTKQGNSVAPALPSTGIYEGTIRDSSGRPRINLFLVAANSANAMRLAAQLQKAHSLMEDWNDDYAGWPIHEFQRAYLEALVFHLKRPSRNALPVTESSARRDGVASEPEFLPQPGVFPGDTRVTLRCSTPGAVMHYTVDSSQPLSSSPVYEAPIIVKGTELTIKAFAAAPGKKDSAVVTGIFRIEEKSAAR